MRAVDLHSKRLERTVGLTVPQLLVLQSLAGSDNATVGEVAGGVHLSQGTVTAVLDRLAGKGFVTRTRSDTDRRKVCVMLTPEGKAKLAETPNMLQEGFVQRFEALASWEQKMLTASLERVAELLDARDVDAAPILETGDLLVSPGANQVPTPPKR